MLSEVDAALTRAETWLRDSIKIGPRSGTDSAALNLTFDPVFGI